MARPRVLVCVSVTAGGATSLDPLEALAGAPAGGCDLDILVLDDAGPGDAGRDARRAACEAAGAAYYRTPSVLGRSRSINLALGRALAGDHDFVLLVDAGVGLTGETVSAMIRAAEANARVGSVTAWASGPSRFAIPNDEPDALADDAEAVRWTASVLAQEFATSVVDVPAGECFCLLVPVPVVRRVGLFDPVFGSGSHAEVDWSLRSRTLGYRAVLAPSAFVARRGGPGPSGPGGRARAVAVAAEGRDVVDLRYPWYRADVDAFAASRALENAGDRARRVLLVRAAAEHGYQVEATWAPATTVRGQVHVVVDPDGRRRTATTSYAGFRLELEVSGGDLPGFLVDALHGAPARIVVHDRGLFAEQLAATWAESVPFDDHCHYPQRI